MQTSTTELRQAYYAVKAKSNTQLHNSATTLSKQGREQKLSHQRNRKFAENNQNAQISVADFTYNSQPEHQLHMFADTKTIDEIDEETFKIQQNLMAELKQDFDMHKDAKPFIKTPTGAQQLKAMFQLIGSKAASDEATERLGSLQAQAKEVIREVVFNDADIDNNRDLINILKAEDPLQTLNSINTVLKENTTLEIHSREFFDNISNKFGGGQIGKVVAETIVGRIKDFKENDKTQVLENIALELEDTSVNDDFSQAVDDINSTFHKHYMNNVKDTEVRVAIKNRDPELQELSNKLIDVLHDRKESLNAIFELKVGQGQDHQALQKYAKAHTIEPRKIVENFRNEKEFAETNLGILSAFKADKKKIPVDIVLRKADFEENQELFEKLTGVEFGDLDAKKINIVLDKTLDSPAGRESLKQYKEILDDKVRINNKKISHAVKAFTKMDEMFLRASTLSPHLKAKVAQTFRADDGSEGTGKLVYQVANDYEFKSDLVEYTKDILAQNFGHEKPLQQLAILSSKINKINEHIDSLFTEPHDKVIANDVIGSGDMIFDKLLSDIDDDRVSGAVRIAYQAYKDDLEAHNKQQDVMVEMHGISFAGPRDAFVKQSLKAKLIATYLSDDSNVSPLHREHAKLYKENKVKIDQTIKMMHHNAFSVFKNLDDNPKGSSYDVISDAGILLDGDKGALELLHDEDFISLLDGKNDSKHDSAWLENKIKDKLTNIIEMILKTLPSDMYEEVLDMSAEENNGKVEYDLNLGIDNSHLEDTAIIAYQKRLVAQAPTSS
jgi:hypothetical protein